MSSSKIQEYNLDPNMGLAKESSVQEVLSAVGSGVTANVVKSVQFQSKTGKNTSATFTISSVNPSKSMVLINGNATSGGSATSSQFALATFTSTQVVVDVDRAAAGEYTRVSIQVIEFC